MDVVPPARCTRVLANSNIKWHKASDGWLGAHGERFFPLEEFVWPFVGFNVWEPGEDGCKQIDFKQTDFGTVEVFLDVIGWIVGEERISDDELFVSIRDGDSLRTKKKSLKQINI